MVYPSRLRSTSENCSCISLRFLSENVDVGRNGSIPAAADIHGSADVYYQ
eukprot:COSAG02_NODE_53098_length_304_cov_0.414634_1_plen_49_part_10